MRAAGLMVLFVAACGGSGSGSGLAHTVNRDANPPPSAAGVPGGGVTATQTIATPGSYSYHCSIHPGMRGTLVVQ